MKVKQFVGGYVLTLGFLSSEAFAQSSEHHAALDPAVAPREAAPPSAGVAPTTAPSAEPGATPPPETAPSSAAPSSAAPPTATVTATAPPALSSPPATPATPAPVPGFVARDPALPLTVGDAGPRRDAPEGPPAQRAIRSQRRLALLGEVGWNSLGGWGLMMTYNAHPHVAFDVAGGFSMTGWKAGLRGRYNLLKGPFTPFLGAGLSMSTGWDGVRIGGNGRDRDEHDDFDFDPTEEGKYDVKRSEFAQAVVGFEFIHRHGFTMQVTGGYSWLLRNDNATFVTGKRDDTLASALFGSGPVASLACGYAFD